MDEKEKEKLKDLKAVYSGAIQSGEIGIANMIKGGIDLIAKLQKENEGLKEERQIVGIPVRNKRDGRIGIVLHQWESGSVAVLESINPRAINTHDSWNTLEIVTDEVKQTQTKCETIPVSLVKDKIEELKEQYNVRELDFIKTTQDIRNIIIQSLEELIEGRKLEEDKL